MIVYLSSSKLVITVVGVKRAVKIVEESLHILQFCSGDFGSFGVLG